MGSISREASSSAITKRSYLQLKSKIMRFMPHYKLREGKQIFRDTSALDIPPNAKREVESNRLWTLEEDSKASGKESSISYQVIDCQKSKIF